jgi:hypothetical protein
MREFGMVNSNPGGRGVGEAERDLLKALLRAEGVAVRNAPDGGADAVAVEVAANPQGQIAYPWNPAEGEDFFNRIESNGLLSGLDGDEVTARSADFFAKLDQVWARDLQTTLARKFVTVPPALLAAIARQAQQVAQTASNTANSLADQLVDCVQSILPTWAPEDLQVFARPLAYAMRGGESAAPTKDWEQLSETERAKLMLTIARYAIHQVQGE